VYRGVNAVTEIFGKKIPKIRKDPVFKNKNFGEKICKFKKTLKSVLKISGEKF
jgi:hypothetical protein